jgi:hypothetical protein
MSRRQSSSKPSTIASGIKPRRRYSRNPVSGKPGAVHIARRCAARPRRRALRWATRAHVTSPPARRLATNDEFSRWATTARPYVGRQAEGRKGVNRDETLVWMTRRMLSRFFLPIPSQVLCRSPRDWAAARGPLKTAALPRLPRNLPPSSMRNHNDEPAWLLRAQRRGRSAAGYGPPGTPSRENGHRRRALVGCMGSGIGVVLGPL